LATAHNYFTSEVNADSKPNIKNTNQFNVNKLDLHVENTCDIQFCITVYSAVTCYTLQKPQHVIDFG